MGFFDHISPPTTHATTSSRTTSCSVCASESDTISEVEQMIVTEKALDTLISPKELNESKCILY